MPGAWQVELPARHSPTGKRSTRTFSGPDAEKSARAWRDKLDEAVRFNGMGFHRALTVAEACQEWFDGPWGKAMRPSTRRTVESAIRKHIQPALDVPVGHLTETQVLRFISVKLDAGLSVHHVRTIVNIVQRACRVICQEEGLAFPAMGSAGEILSRAAGARELEVEEVRFWSREEIDLILCTAEEGPAWFSAFVRVAADTGMRRGEIMGLQVADLDMLQAELRVRRAIVDDEQVSTKNRKARTVVMASGLHSVLWAHLEASHFTEKGRPQWLFSGSGEGHLTIREVRTAWDRLRRRFKARGVRPLKFHSFRHSWATHAIAAGEPIPWVSAQLGHLSAAFTLRQYAHAEPRRESKLEWLQRPAGSSSSSEAPGEAPQPARLSQMANPVRHAPGAGPGRGGRA